MTGGLKPRLVADLGAAYHHGTIAAAGIAADVVIECTGAGQLVFDAMEARRGQRHRVPDRPVIGRPIPDRRGRVLNRRMVLENDVVFGSVNAGRRHYEAGAKALAAADRFWLNLLVTRKVPLGHWQEAYQRRPGDVKTVLQFAS